MARELGLRERKKIERRECIERAAIDLFEANGFESTTVEEIAAAADIAPRTFFSYFPTKEDVVLADYAARLDRIINQLRQHSPTDPPWDALRAAFMVVSSDYVSERDQLVRRFAIIASNESVYARSLQLQAGWEDSVTAVLTERAGIDDDNLTPQLMASAALACMRSSLRYWMLTTDQSDLPTLVQDCFDRLASGLRES